MPGEPGWDGGRRGTIHAKGTRLSLELRRPIPDSRGSLRIYSEYDFFGDSSSSGMDFRARHFYSQAWNVLIGQTFTAFMDVDAFPDVVDYQGPNGIVNRRQPQLRYTHPLYDGDHKALLFASVEQPGGRIDTAASGFPAGASVVNHVPDAVLGARWESGHGHVQLSGIARQLAYETDVGIDEETVGWGASLSGSLNVFTTDKLSAQVTYGEGVARYINDLGGQNYDAAMDGGRLVALPVFAAMVGYTHPWNAEWRSTLAGGYVQVDAPASLGGLALDHTLYGSLNLMWHPTVSFRTGLEFLTGAKETANDAEREAYRINFVIRCDLIR